MVGGSARRLDAAVSTPGSRPSNAAGRGAHNLGGPTMRTVRLSIGVRGRFVLGALLMGALAVLVPGNSATAQQGQGQYLTEASQRLGKLIARANQDGFTFDENKFSIGGGWL